MIDPMMCGSRDYEEPSMSQVDAGKGIDSRPAAMGAEKLLLWVVGVALLAFFLPWVKMTGFLNSTNSGWSLATSGESAASGKNLAIFFVTGLAAAVMLVMAAPSIREKVGITAPILQVVLAVVAVFPMLVVLPAELDYWSGGTISRSFGFWLALLAFFVLAVMGVVEMARLLKAKRVR